MNPLIIYMVKASLYLAAFYIVYALFLSKDTLYGRNRMFVLFSVVFSMILPLITIPTGKSLNIPVFSRMLSEITVGQTAGLNVERSSWIQSVSIVYFAGVILFGLKLFIDLTELLLLIIRNKNKGEHIVRFHGFKTAGFSAFGHVFVNKRLSDDEVKEIIRHEQSHLDHFHSLDIIFMEITKIFQWFNPVIYFFGRSLRAVHEYQADAGCLNTGIPVGNYQRLLLNQVFKSKVFTITNSFSNPTLIKKRMIMMTRQRSQALANLKLILVVPVIAAAMLLISSCSQKNEPAAPPPPPPPPPTGSAFTQEPLQVVEQMPVFAGGDLALLKFLSENTKYPDAAKVKGVMGKVIVRFAVEPDGSVDRISIIKGVDPELDKESIRVVSMLKFDKPGYQEGKAVPVWYMVPINFTLK